jgi:hypothetical protein
MYFSDMGTGIAGGWLYPLCREFLALQKNFEKPQAAGNAIARQQNKKPSAKAKAKNKA